MTKMGILVLGLFACASTVLAEDPPSRITPTVRAYQKARHAVVNISSEQIVTTRMGAFGADIFDEIFPSPFRREVPVQNLGSGFLVNPSGYIVTNAHVVRRATKITVTLADQSKFPAAVISADAAHDLAVLKIDPPKGGSLPHLPLGRSDDLLVAETVIAIGNPMGLGHSVSSGIISQVGRRLEFGDGVVYEGLIQTDAPINPGNSGGPLLNIRGELIGITTAIRADAQSIGFAIPVDKLAEEFPRLLDFERLNRVVFGAEIRQRHAKDGDELYIAAVRAGTPAASKLKTGDLIMSVNGRPVAQATDYECAMLEVKPPAKVRLVCRRDGKDGFADVEVLAKPRPDGKALGEQLFGMTLREITPQVARDLSLAVEQGLLVVGIDAGSPADRIGLKLKDVVFQVGRLYVKDLGSLGMVLEDVPAGTAMRIGVARGGMATWVAIQARGKAEKPAPKAGKTGGGA
jgi:serine protease Do